MNEQPQENQEQRHAIVGKVATLETIHRKYPARFLNQVLNVRMPRDLIRGTDDMHGMLNAVVLDETGEIMFDILFGSDHYLVTQKDLQDANPNSIFFFHLQESTAVEKVGELKREELSIHEFRNRMFGVFLETRKKNEDKWYKWLGLPEGKCKIESSTGTLPDPGDLQWLPSNLLAVNSSHIEIRNRVGGVILQHPLVDLASCTVTWKPKGNHTTPPESSIEIRIRSGILHYTILWMEKGDASLEIKMPL